MVLACAVALPCVAHAQEPQPWTNTSAFGDRVVPALPAGAASSTAVRADGGAGSTSSFNLTVDRGAPGEGPSTRASFLAGRSGVSYGWDSFDVFLTSYAYRVAIPKLARNTETGPLAVDPYTQSGDVSLGGRWVHALDDSRRFNVGVEGGALFLGATGDPGETGVVLAGPNTSATSPFARGLFTWQGLAKGNAEPALTVSANLGVFADRSWNVWKETAKNQEDAVDRPLEEERIALSFYGDESTATRLLFGASASYQLGRIARPYLELTGESTSPDLTMRLTPGVAIEPLAGTPLALFLSADVDLSGDPEVSPRGPAVRANAGLQLAFGARSGRPRAARTPSPQSTPAPSRRFSYPVKVVDENNRPIPGARVRVVTTEGTLLDEDGTGPQGVTDALSLPGSATNQSVVIQARHPEYAEWLPVTFPARAAQPPVITLYGRRTLVKFDYLDRGKEWNPPAPQSVRVLVTPMVSRPGERPPAPREFVGVPVEVPFTEAFRKVAISIGVLDYSKAHGAVDDLQPPTVTLRVYLDGEKRCADFSQDKCGAATPASTPAAGGNDRFAFNIFAGDSVDLNAAAATKLLGKLRPITAARGPHLVIVQARKGDPLFQAALAAARRDALLAWLNANQILPELVKIETDHEAGGDSVILEVPK